MASYKALENGAMGGSRNNQNINSGNTVNWTCKECTFTNLKNINFCEMCNVNKNNPTATSQQNNKYESGSENKKSNQKTVKSNTENKCFLCGNSKVSHKCNHCQDKSFCDICYEHYHSHPQRKWHSQQFCSSTMSNIKLHTEEENKIQLAYDDIFNDNATKISKLKEDISKFITDNHQLINSIKATVTPILSDDVEFELSPADNERLTAVSLEHKQLWKTEKNSLKEQFDARCKVEWRQLGHEQKEQLQRKIENSWEIKKSKFNTEKLKEEDLKEEFSKEEATKWGLKMEGMRIMWELKKESEWKAEMLKHKYESYRKSQVKWTDEHKNIMNANFKEKLKHMQTSIENSMCKIETLPQNPGDLLQELNQLLQKLQQNTTTLSQEIEKRKTTNDKLLNTISIKDNKLVRLSDELEVAKQLSTKEKERTIKLENALSEKETIVTKLQNLNTANRDQIKNLKSVSEKLKCESEKTKADLETAKEDFRKHKDECKKRKKEIEEEKCSAEYELLKKNYELENSLMSKESEINNLNYLIKNLQTRNVTNNIRETAIQPSVEDDADEEANSPTQQSFNFIHNQAIEELANKTATLNYGNDEDKTEQMPEANSKIVNGSKTPKQQQNDFSRQMSFSDYSGIIPSTHYTPYMTDIIKQKSEACLQHENNQAHSSHSTPNRQSSGLCSVNFQEKTKETNQTSLPTANSVSPVEHLEELQIASQNLEVAQTAHSNSPSTSIMAQDILEKYETFNLEIANLEVAQTEHSNSSSTSIMAQHNQTDMPQEAFNVLVIDEWKIHLPRYINALYNYLNCEDTDTAVNEKPHYSPKQLYGEYVYEKNEYNCHEYIISPAWLTNRFIRLIVTDRLFSGPLKPTSKTTLQYLEDKNYNYLHAIIKLEGNFDQNMRDEQYFYIHKNVNQNVITSKFTQRPLSSNDPLVIAFDTNIYDDWVNIHQFSSYRVTEELKMKWSSSAKKWLELFKAFLSSKVSHYWRDSIAVMMAMKLKDQWIIKFQLHLRNFSKFETSRNEMKTYQTKLLTVKAQRLKGQYNDEIDKLQRSVEEWQNKFYEDMTLGNNLYLFIKENTRQLQMKPFLQSLKDSITKRPDPNNSIQKYAEYIYEKITKDQSANQQILTSDYVLQLGKQNNIQF